MCMWTNNRKHSLLCADVRLHSHSVTENRSFDEYAFPTNDSSIKNATSRLYSLLARNPSKPTQNDRYTSCMYETMIHLSQLCLAFLSHNQFTHTQTRFQNKMQQPTLSKCSKAYHKNDTKTPKTMKKRKTKFTFIKLTLSIGCTRNDLIQIYAPYKSS